jgi:hypothetical protein
MIERSRSDCRLEVDFVTTLVAFRRATTCMCLSSALRFKPNVLQGSTFNTRKLKDAPWHSGAVKHCFEHGGIRYLRSAECNWTSPRKCQRFEYHCSPHETHDNVTCLAVTAQTQYSVPALRFVHLLLTLGLLCKNCAVEIPCALASFSQLSPAGCVSPYTIAQNLRATHQPQL